MSVRLLDRYLLVSFLRIFGVAVASAPLLFVLADITGRLDGYLARGMTVMEIILIYPSQLPTYVSWAVPIAALVATLFTLQPLAKHGELNAALGCGIPLQRLFVPLFAGGAIASALAIILLEATPSARASREAAPTERDRAQRGAFAYRTDSGDVLSAERLLGGADARMLGVVLHRASADPRRSAQFIVAGSAVWNDQEGWVLERGNAWSIARDGAPSHQPFERLAFPRLSERPEYLLEAHSVDPAGMTFRELDHFADRLERSGAPAAYARIKQWERVTIPLVTLIIIGFAAPLATIAGRGNGQNGAALSLVTTMAYLAILRLSEGLGVAGLLHPALATSIPALIFGVAALILLRRART